MATNIPPHNLREVIGAVVKIIDDQIEENRETTIEEIMKIVKGPDFPTGATILGTRGIEEAYRTGRGKIRVRAVTNIEPMAERKEPYRCNRASVYGQQSPTDREDRRACTEIRRLMESQI